MTESPTPMARQPSFSESPRTQKNANEIAEKSLERTRAGHVSWQCGRARPPASLSSGVGQFPRDECYAITKLAVASSSKAESISGTGQPCRRRCDGVVGGNDGRVEGRQRHVG